MRRAVSELENQFEVKRDGWLVIDTRHAFRLVTPHIEEYSKVALTIAGLIFAGSLTFIGLGKGTLDLNDIHILKLSWFALGVSMVLQLIIFLLIIGGNLSDTRAQIAADKAAELMSVNNAIRDEALKETIKSHRHQSNFFAAARWTIPMLIGQVLSLVTGGVLMSVFVIENLG